MPEPSSTFQVLFPASANTPQKRIAIIDFSDLPNLTTAAYAIASEQISSLVGLNRRTSRRIGKLVSRVVECFRPANLLEHSIFVVEGPHGWALLFRFITDPIDPDDAKLVSAIANLQRGSDRVGAFSAAGEPSSGYVIEFSQPLESTFEPPAPREVKQWARIIGKGDWESAFDLVTRQFLQERARLQQLRDGVSIRREVLNDDGQQANTLLTLIASKTDNAMLLLDAEGKIEWMNQACQTTFHVSEKQCLHVNVKELFFNTDMLTAPERLSGKRQLRRNLAQGHSFSLEYYRESDHDEDRQRWTSFQLTPVRDEHDTIVRWIAIGSDVTQRRKAEMATQAAREVAESANRAKSDFLAMMSHEIRTPMNAIMGMTELALGTTLTREQRTYLTTARNSAQALLQILNDVLDLSKVEAAQLTLESIAFQLENLVEDTLESLGVLASAKGIDLKFHFPSDVPARLLGDPNRLRQIIVNLVGNAIKFTAVGEVAFACSVTDKTARSVTLHFSVRDTGVGIAEEKTSRIFEAFYQTDASVTRNFGGTGLGLAITSQLVRLMGGRIWVESKLGQGSVFHVVLTFRTVKSKAEPEKNQDLAPAETLETDAGLDSSASDDPNLANSWEQMKSAINSRRILVVDDHPSNRLLITEILRKREHVCLAAASGKEALVLIEEHSFDLILMDVQMPEQDGFETTRLIRQQDPQYNNVPIVAVTAYVSAEDRRQCEQAGMNGFLPKPVDARSLIQLIEKNQISGSAWRTAESSKRWNERWSELNETSTQSLADQSAESKELGSRFGLALERMGGDRTLLQQQMNYFVDEVPDLLSGIRTAIQDSDLRRLRLNAHRTRGLFRSFDDGEADELAGVLEKMHGPIDCQRAMDLHDALSKRWQHLRATILDYLAGVSPTEKVL